MYCKSNACQGVARCAQAESLADVLYEIGKDLADRKDFPMSSKWLERAYDAVNRPPLEQLSREAVELRLSISQALVQAYLALVSTEGYQKAENHVSCIESEIGDKLVVLLLKLEILFKSPAEVFDCHAYGAILRRMIERVDLSDSTFKLIMHHIRKLDDKGPSWSCDVLDEFLVTRLLPSLSDQWIEHAMVLRTHMTTSCRDMTEAIDGLQKILDTVHKTKEKPLSVNCSLAVQTVGRINNSLIPSWTDELSAGLEESRGELRPKGSQ
jgi:hypothetical protein